MYYIMECPLITGEDHGGELIEIHHHFKLAGIRLWKTGRLLKPEQKKDIPNPVEFNFDAYHGYSGPPLELEDLGIPLMSKNLGETLKNAGVDNIEFFPAILKNKETGQSYDYYVYNIIGKVAAADLQQSEYETYRNKPPLADTTIHKLVLDESRIQGLLLFRLAENVGTIVVHESIKKRIESAGIETIQFIKPEDYACI